MKRIAITGAGGFVGHHVLEHVLASTTWQVVATDSFRHRGKTDRIAQLLGPNPHWRPRLEVVTHDLQAPFTDQMIYQLGHIDYLIAVASESHVDRSINDPVHFVRNNVNLALSTLEFAREVKPKAVIWISTDEVYGAVQGGVKLPEWSPIIPSNPYAASKAAQEALAISYWRTFDVPVIIVNIMNIVGERQDPEKFVPMLIRDISAGKEVTIHGRPGEIGTRHYLHARNVADALTYILDELPPHTYDPGLDRPDRYNVVGPDRLSNLDLAEMVAAIVGRPLKYQLVEGGRPGHDLHYGLDPAKLTGLGWKPPIPFQESLARTVRWSLRNPEWLL
jgi:dTDP-glucose 4,6-dehydratase